MRERKIFGQHRAKPQSPRSSTTAQFQRSSGQPRSTSRSIAFPRRLQPGKSKKKRAWSLWSWLRPRPSQLPPKASARSAQLAQLRQRSTPSPTPTRSTPAPVIPLSRSRLPAAQRSQTRRQQRVAAQRSQPLLQWPQPHTKSGWAVLYGTRLLILGIGLGVLAGTLLSVWDPASRLSVGAVAEQSAATEVKPEPGLPLGQENLELKSRIAALLPKYAQMKAGILLLDLDTRAYVDVNASATFAAASTIKLPILVAFFQDVDAGKIQLNEMLTMRKELVATEAGEMQYQPVNSKFSALQTVTQMMVISDNTATNMVIDHLGGIEVLNQRFQSWGLSHTRLQNLLPDVEGVNTTTPQDLALLMDQIQQGNLVSMKSRDRLLDIMRRTENDSLLPQGLNKGATIAHKTGTIGTMIGDIGLIDTPTGKRFLASVLVQRPRDDHRATELIQQLSKAAYQVFSQTTTQSAQQSLEPGKKD